MSTDSKIYSRRLAIATLLGVPAAVVLQHFIEKETIHRKMDEAAHGLLKTTPQFDQFIAQHPEHGDITKKIGFAISSIGADNATTSSCFLLAKNLLVHSAHQIHASVLSARFMTDSGQSLDITAKPQFYNKVLDVAFSTLDDSQAEKAERAGIKPISVGQPQFSFESNAPAFILGFLPERLLNVVEGQIVDYIPSMKTSGEPSACKIMMMEMPVKLPAVAGMSGGAVIDSQGNAIGILSSVGTVDNNPGQFAFFTPIISIMNEWNVLFPNSAPPALPRRPLPVECQGNYSQYNF